MTDMGNAEILTAADLSWRYTGFGQENMTYDLERETRAAWAELYTEAGELLVAMRRYPRPGYDDGPAWWFAHHSELLSRAALDSLPEVATIDQLDMHMILDLEILDAREAS